MRGKGLLKLLVNPRASGQINSIKEKQAGSDPIPSTDRLRTQVFSLGLRLAVKSTGLSFGR